MVSNQRSDMVESASNVRTRHGKPAFETSSINAEQSAIDRASPQLRTGMFIYTAVEVVLLLAAGATYMIRTDLVATYLPRDWERAALQALWFGMLGGAAISLKGIYDHRTQREWEGGWALWYLGRPVSSALTGVMTYVLLQVANPNSPPAAAVLAVAAFTLGTQERRFFDFLYEVAKLVLAVPQDRARVIAPTPLSPPEPSLASSPRRMSTITALPTSPACWSVTGSV